MIENPISNIFGEALVRMCPEIDTSFLDSNNLVWKVVNGKWIGKRSVSTIDNRSCWLEETSPANVKDWPCGENADYNEIFNWPTYDKYL